MCSVSSALLDVCFILQCQIDPLLPWNCGSLPHIVIACCRLVLLYSHMWPFLLQRLYTEKWNKDKTTIHVMPDTPDILLSRVNQITMSDVSRWTPETKMRGGEAEGSQYLWNICLPHANHFKIRIPVLTWLTRCWHFSTSSLRNCTKLAGKKKRRKDMIWGLMPSQ